MGNSIFEKIVRIIVGEYEQREVYKRCNVVDNGPDRVLETYGAICRVDQQMQRGFHGRDEPYLFCTYSVSAGDRPS